MPSRRPYWCVVHPPYRCRMCSSTRRFIMCSSTRCRIVQPTSRPWWSSSRHRRSNSCPKPWSWGYWMNSTKYMAPSEQEYIPCWRKWRATIASLKAYPSSISCTSSCWTTKSPTKLWHVWDPSSPTKSTSTTSSWSMRCSTCALHGDPSPTKIGRCRANWMRSLVLATWDSTISPAYATWTVWFSSCSWYRHFVSPYYQQMIGKILHPYPITCSTSCSAWWLLWSSHRSNTSALRSSAMPSRILMVNQPMSSSRWMLTNSSTCWWTASSRRSRRAETKL